MRHFKRLSGAVIVIALFALVACVTKGLDAAKIAQNTADQTWTSVQETFARARLAGERAEQANRVVAPGEITQSQWGRFSALDRKVVMAGRELARATKAVEAGVKPNTDPAQLTRDLFSFFEETKRLAIEFGLKIPELPKAPTAALPLLMVLAAAGIGVVPMRRGAPIQGGSAAGDIAGLITMMAGAAIEQVGPIVAQYIGQNPGDQAKAQAAAVLFAKFVTGIGAKLPGIIEGSHHPSDIKLDELWDQDAEQVLARLRAAGA